MKGGESGVQTTILRVSSDFTSGVEGTHRSNESLNRGPVYRKPPTLLPEYSYSVQGLN